MDNEYEQLLTYIEYLKGKVAPPEMVQPTGIDMYSYLWLGVVIVGCGVLVTIYMWFSLRAPRQRPAVPTIAPAESWWQKLAKMFQFKLPDMPQFGLEHLDSKYLKLLVPLMLIFLFYMTMIVSSVDERYIKSYQQTCTVDGNQVKNSKFFDTVRWEQFYYYNKDNADSSATIVPNKSPSYPLTTFYLVVIILVIVIGLGYSLSKKHDIVFNMTMILITVIALIAYYFREKRPEFDSSYSESITSLKSIILNCFAWITFIGIIYSTNAAAVQDISPTGMLLCAVGVFLIFMFSSSVIPNIDSSFISGHAALEFGGTEWAIDFGIAGLIYILANMINNYNVTGLLLLTVMLSAMIFMHRYTGILKHPRLPFMFRTEVDHQCQIVDTTMLTLQYIIMLIMITTVILRRGTISPMLMIGVILLMTAVGYQYFTYYKEVLIAEVEQCKELFAPVLDGVTIPTFTTDNIFTNISMILEGPLFKYIVDYNSNSINP